MKKILTLLAPLLLLACQNAPSGYTPEPLNFSSHGKIGVNVAEIRITDNYQSTLKPPYVEQNFPVSPASAVHEWVKQRLVATGTSGVMEVVIDNASVKETLLPKTQGIKGLFTDDQDTRYDLALNVSLRLYTGARGISDATGDVTITRSRSINEKATVVDHERLYHGMLRDTMETFDGQAEARLRQYFSAYLK